jgi:hypothetical protein
MPPLRRPKGRFAIAAIALTSIFGACSKSGDNTASATFTGATMLPGPLAYLDSTLYVVFADELDPDTVNEQSVQLLAVGGTGRGIPVRGIWRVGSLGTGTSRNTIEFEPDLPNATPMRTSGGLQPDTSYELRITGGPVHNAVQTQDGRRLKDSLLYTFLTRSGLASQRYEHNLEGGPRLVDAVPSPRDAEGNWHLGRSNEGAVLRMVFDQPLDPSEENLPRSPSASARGPIALLYDDPEYGPDTWIPCDIELERNAVLGTTVALHPRGVLPSAANLRITISGGLRDLFGEDRNTPGAAVAGTIATETAYEPQFDAVAFDFAQNMTLGDPDFAEVPAVIANGALRVPDTFPALEGVGDWSPHGTETLLRTDVQTLQYEYGAARTFEGGVLHMKNLHIHAGQVVRGTGPNPLVLVVDGDAVIDGLLSVSGADAQQFLLGQYRGPGDWSLPGSGSGGSGGTAVVPGPTGGPGGSNGGHLPATASLEATVDGSSPSAAPGAGGIGGPHGCDDCTRSAGGGGGSMATAGDPWFPSPAGSGTQFVQRRGDGGYGCSGNSGAISRILAGGSAGEGVFRNADANDDCWGEVYVPWLGQRRTGELPNPVGGAGGGTGGSYPWDGTCTTTPFFYRGADGGGGAGVIVLQVRGTLTVGPTGHIEANGGNGTRRLYYYSDEIGGGGAGAGGMIVLMAGRAIVLHAHGETFANRDYDFALSADGGICRPGARSSLVLPSKYPANGSPTFSGSTYDFEPLGGFGGLGVIQLMVPPGSDNADGTNTVLDDAITIVRNGIPLQGTEKQRFLGWRGFQSEYGIYLDDFGMPTDTIGGQGDMRPDPLLMPVPYASQGRARARSTWLPLSGLARRSVPAPDGQPRAVVGEPLIFGNHARTDGWLPFGNGLLTAIAGGEELLAQPATIESLAVDTTTFDRPVYAVKLAATLPQTERDAYASTVAHLTRIAGGSVARLRVIGNTSDTLYLEVQSALPGVATHVQLHAFHAELATPVPASYLGANATLVPRANAQIGFAFHRDPANARTTGLDPNRFPAQTGTFLFDLAAPSTRSALQAFGATAMQWDALLEGEYRSEPADAPPPADANSAIGLRRFWLPVRF